MMRRLSKSIFLLLFVGLFFSNIADAAETIKLRTLVANPSSTKVQKKSVKNYLPAEIKLKNILESGGLDVDYDDEQSLYYVYKNDIELGPSESKVFEVVLEDVWNVEDEVLNRLQKRTESALESLKGSAFLDQAQPLANTIFGRLDEIKKIQTDKSVTKSQHIAYYRDNMKVLDGVRKDIDEIEKLIKSAGGPPKVTPEMNVDLKKPNNKTTWIVIFCILVFIAILGAAFYFTWHSQINVAENIFTREKDLSFSEFKEGKGDKSEDGEKHKKG